MKLSLKQLSIALGIILFSFAWRWPWIISEKVASDEWPSIYTAVEIYEKKNIPIYVAGQDYMAPLKEAVSYPFIMIFGKELLSFRIVSVIFFICSSLLGFKILKDILGIKLSLAIIICYIFPAITVNRYDTSVIGQYAGTMFLGILMIYLILKWDYNKKITWVILYSIVGGFSYYVFSISIFQYVSGLIWVFLRSRKWKYFANGNNIKSTLYLGLGSASSIIVCFYRPLTQSKPLLFDFFQVSLTIITAVFLLCITINSIKSFNISKTDIPIIAAAMMPFILISSMPSFLFKLIVYPKLQSFYDVSLYSIGYSWKHAHEWHNQIFNFFNSVLPRLYFGNRLTEMKGGDVFSSEILPITIVFWFYIFLCLLIIIYKTLDIKILSPIWLFILPVLMNALVLIPSWRIFGDASYRYMVPYFLGCLVILFAPFAFLSIRYHFIAIIFSFIFSTYNFLEQQSYFKNLKNTNFALNIVESEGTEVDADLLIAPWCEIFRIWFYSKKSQNYEVAEKITRGFFSPCNRKDFKIVAFSKTSNLANCPEWILKRGSLVPIPSKYKHWNLFMLN